MDVGIYSSPLCGIQKPTGVGQHITKMAEGLVASRSLNSSLIATRKDYAQVHPFLSEQLAGMQVDYLPYSDKLMRWLLIGGGLSVDRWTRNLDWVYCPKEQPIFTRRARLAVTVHDVLPFEQSIPGLTGRRRASSVIRWKLLMSRILSRADIIATVSEFTRRRLLELFPIKHEERVVVVGNGVAPQYFQRDTTDDQEILDYYGLSPRQYLITVGSLTYRKGGDGLLELAKIIRQRKISQEIVITGRRHDADLLAKFRSAKKDTPDIPIQLLGFVSDREQAALLRHSTALLFPSRYEGFGIPVVEAMACGTPVLCTRAAALPEIAGNAALFLESDNVEQWLEAISDVSHFSQVRCSLVDLGRERAFKFKWDACVDRLVSAMAR